MKIFVKIAFAVCFTFFTLQAQAGISPRIFNALNDLQTQISEQPSSDQVLEILDDLNELLESLKGNALGQALTLQTLSQLADYQEKWQLSLEYLEQAAVLKGLQKDTKLQLQASLAFAYFRQEEYKKTATLLNDYLKNSKEEPAASIYALLAASYYGLEEFGLGLPYIEKAITLTDKPKEHWLQMAFSGHYQAKRYDSALVYVNQLVFFYPDKKVYWQQKAGLHQMLEQYPSAARAKSLSQLQGLLEKEGEYINLVQLLASQGSPYHVASSLEKVLADGGLEASEKLLNLHYQAWLQAKEIDKAILVLQSLFNDYQQPKHGVSLVQFHVDAENWDKAITTAEAVLKLDVTEKQKGQTLLLNGISLHKDKKDRKALIKLSQALSIETSAAQAKGWMNYIKQKSQ